ncbi:MAG: hypothetical protein IPK73_24885 [Candidatus Obscuribacter sp.]|nr:hypothetical protein [Candidatus Obscuribacter sp.]MBK9277353.1 hypothetical protein [Candidatus Obscuribacter sp.]
MSIDRRQPSSDSSEKVTGQTFSAPILAENSALRDANLTASNSQELLDRKVLPHVTLAQNTTGSVMNDAVKVAYNGSDQNQGQRVETRPKWSDVVATPQNTGSDTRARVETQQEVKTVPQPGSGAAKLSVDQSGRPVSVVDKNGLERQFRYDQSGAPSEMKMIWPDGNSQTWKRENGSWMAYDKDGKFTGRRFEGAISVERDGRVRQLNAVNGDETINMPDGTQRVVKYQERVRSHQDGSRVVMEGGGERPSIVAAKDGSYRRYQYDAQGKLVRSENFDSSGKLSYTLQTENGKWTLRDAQGKPVNIGPVTEVSTDKDGNMTTKWQNGAYSINRNDGSQVKFDTRGRLFEAEDTRGQKRRFGYDEKNQLNRYEWQAPDGQHSVWRKEGETWKNYRGDGTPGSKTVDSVKVDQNGTVEVIDKSIDRKMYFTLDRMMISYTLDGKPVGRSSLDVQPNNGQRRRQR